MKKIIAFLFCILSSVLTYSQEVEMADELRSSGKIYVVVGVLVTILLGIVVYLILIDRKINDIEKRIRKK